MGDAVYHVSEVVVGEGFDVLDYGGGIVVEDGIWENPVSMPLWNLLILRREAYQRPSS